MFCFFGVLWVFCKITATTTPSRTSWYIHNKGDQPLWKENEDNAGHSLGLESQEVLELLVSAHFLWQMLSPVSWVWTFPRFIVKSSAPAYCKWKTQVSSRMLVTINQVTWFSRTIPALALVPRGIQSEHITVLYKKTTQNSTSKITIEYWKACSRDPERGKGDFTVQP